MFWNIVIISLVILLITFLSCLPIFIFEKQEKEIKKKFIFTRIYSYLFLLPTIMIYCSLISDFRNFDAHGGWLLISWFFYSPFALLLYFVPMLIDEILYAIFKKKNEKDETNE